MSRLRVRFLKVKRDEVINITVFNHCLTFEDHLYSYFSHKASYPQLRNFLCGMLPTSTIATAIRLITYVDATIADVTILLKHSSAQQEEILPFENVFLPLLNLFLFLTSILVLNPLGSRMSHLPPKLSMQISHLLTSLFMLLCLYIRQPPPRHWK